MRYFLLGLIPFAFAYFQKLCCGNVIDDDVDEESN